MFEEIVLQNCLSVDQKIVKDVILKEQQWQTASKNSTEDLLNVREIKLAENN